MSSRIKEIIELRTKLKAVQETLCKYYTCIEQAEVYMKSVQDLLTEEKRILNELEKNRG